MHRTALALFAVALCALLAAPARGAGYSNFNVFNTDRKNLPSLAKFTANSNSSAGVTYDAGKFQGGKLAFGSLVVSSAGRMTLVVTARSGTTYSAAKAFEVSGAGDDLDVTCVRPLPSGGVVVELQLIGSLPLSGTVTLTSPVGSYGVAVIALDASLAFVQGIISSGGNANAGSCDVDASGNIYAGLSYTSVASLAGHALSNAGSNYNTAVVKLAASSLGYVSSFSGSINGQAQSRIADLAVNRADGTVAIVGAAGPQFYIAKLSATLGLGSTIIIPTTTGSTSSNAVTVDISGTNAYVGFRYSCGGPLTIGSLAAISCSGSFDTGFVVVDLGAMAATAVNTYHSTDGGAQAVTIDRASGLAWGTGVVTSTATLSGTVFSGTTALNEALASVSSAGVFGSATSTIASTGSAIITSLTVTGGVVRAAGYMSGTVTFPGLQSKSSTAQTAFTVDYTP